jgi:endonuclease/exonuclease/phosphatase family metal-dependent hydrolase
VISRDFPLHPLLQLYLSRDDESRRAPGHPARIDTEGPAVFSRFPIVHADYALLSRDPADGGDGHQRVVLHAVLDLTGKGAVAAAPRQLVDVYTVHLALSEAARNRTVPELLAFVRASRRGSLQVCQCASMGAS